MAKLSRSVEIEAPVEKVFDFAMDVGKHSRRPGELVPAFDLRLPSSGNGS